MAPNLKWALKKLNAAGSLENKDSSRAVLITGRFEVSAAVDCLCEAVFAPSKKQRKALDVPQLISCDPFTHAAKKYCDVVPVNCHYDFTSGNPDQSVNVEGSGGDIIPFGAISSKKQAHLHRVHILGNILPESLPFLVKAMQALAFCSGPRRQLLHDSRMGHFAVPNPLTAYDLDSLQNGPALPLSISSSSNTSFNSIGGGGGSDGITKIPMVFTSIRIDDYEAQMNSNDADRDRDNHSKTRSKIMATDDLDVDNLIKKVEGPNSNTPSFTIRLYSGNNALGPLSYYFPSRKFLDTINREAPHSSSSSSSFSSSTSSAGSSWKRFADRAFP
jgi:hypothetical protein